MDEIDEFCKPYKNPRTLKISSGGAARNGRIKTLGGQRGLTAIIEKVVKSTTQSVTKELLKEANSKSRRRGNK